MSGSRQRGRGPTKQAEAHEPPDTSSPERTPIDRLKAPREWRSRARDSRRVLEQRLRADREAPGDEARPERRRRRTGSTDAVRDRSADPGVARSGWSDAKTAAPGVLAPAPAPTPTPIPALPTAPPVVASQVAAAYEAKAQLPERYDEDRIVVLIRDPHWCFVWWEVTPARREALGVVSREPPVLRFFDVTGIEWDGSNHTDSFDVQVHDDVGNWYVEVRRPGASFVVELGLFREDGSFAGIARSNRVAMPQAGPSARVHPAWPVIAGAQFEMTENDLLASSGSSELHAHTVEAEPTARDAGPSTTREAAALSTRNEGT